MNQTCALTGLLAILAFTLYRFIILSALGGPLRNLPNAHPTSPISAQWFKRQVRSSRELKTLYAAHSKHGPIVRLGPNEVSVVSQEGLRKVYVAGLDKTEWYKQTFYNYGVQNLVCTLDHETHSQIRRMIAPLYAKSSVQRSSDLDELSKKIVFRRLIPMLDAYAQKGQAVDVVRLFEWTALDFISAFIFGNGVSTDFLSNQAGRERYFGEWDRLRQSPESNGKPVTEDLFMGMCKTALSSRDMEGRQPLVVGRMWAEMSVKGQIWGLSQEEILKRCASEMVDHVIATQETQAITWTYILYRLSLNPEVQQELKSELRTLRPLVGSHDGNEQLPSPSDIDRLPLLDAVILETLRLHAANPARMQRVVPKDGLILHGYHLPPGTIVSTNAYCLHRNAEVFPQPFDWRPERWLATRGSGKAKGGGTDTQRKWFWAFGSGPRMCIGQHFAVQGLANAVPPLQTDADPGIVLKLIVALIYTHYSTTIVDDEGIEQSDSYNSGPVSHKLVLRFHPA